MGVVIALISVLVVLLSGLSFGLVNDGVSGLRSMKATAFAFDEGTMTDNAFSRSVVDSDQLQAWQDAEGDQVGAVNGIVVSEPLRDAGFEIGTAVTLDRKRSHEICEMLAERAHQTATAVSRRASRRMARRSSALLREASGLGSREGAAARTGRAAADPG